MSRSNKIVKFMAEVLAIVLIGLIIYGISSLIYGVSFIFGTNNKYDNSIMLIQDSFINNMDNFNFKIDSDKTNIKIVKSDSFNVKTNNKSISIDYDKDSNSIIINEKRLPLFNFISSYDMTIYLPSTLFKEVNIYTNSGDVIIDSMVTNKLLLKVGSGKTDIDSLTVYKYAEIETGIGRVEIDGKMINNLELSNGIGETIVNSNISGKSFIKSGVGNIKLILNQAKKYYSFDIKKGIGDIVIDGDNKTEGSYGDGPINLVLETNIGKIDINFKE